MSKRGRVLGLTLFCLPSSGAALATRLGGYHKIEAGFLGADAGLALSLVTGGQVRTLELTSRLSRMWMSNGYLWSMLGAWCARVGAEERGVVLGCVAHRSSEEQFGFSDGLVQGLSYPIVGVAEVKEPAVGRPGVGGGRLVRLANPWGAAAQWQGTLANGSPERETLQLKENSTSTHRASRASSAGWSLQLGGAGEAGFWMRFEDWFHHFDTLHVCSLLPKGWHTVSCHLQAHCTHVQLDRKSEARNAPNMRQGTGQEQMPRYDRKWLHTAAEWGNVWHVKPSHEESSLFFSLAPKRSDGAPLDALPEGSEVHVGLVVLKEEALTTARRASFRHLVTALRPCENEAGVHEAIHLKDYDTGGLIVVPLLHVTGGSARDKERRRQLRQLRCVLTVRCSVDLDVLQLNSKLTAAGQSAGGSWGQGVGEDAEPLSDDEEADGAEIFEAFDPFDQLRDRREEEGNEGHGVGEKEVRGRSQRARHLRLGEREGAQALVDAGQVNDAKVERLVAEERKRTLPLDGLVLQHLGPVEIRLQSLQGEGSLIADKGAKNKFEGLLLKDALRADNPPRLAKALEGHTVMVLPNTAANTLASSATSFSQRVTIQHYDASAKRIVFAQSIARYAGAAGVDVRFEIPACIESRIELKGMAAVSQLERPHWALEKSGRQYLEAALMRCLEVSNQQIRLKFATVGGGVRATLSVTCQAQVDALKEALDKQITNGSIAAFAQQALKRDYTQILEGMQSLTLYKDTSFPAEEASIWGPGEIPQTAQYMPSHARLLKQEVCACQIGR